MPQSFTVKATVGRNGPLSVIVKPGDTLYRIALRHGVTVKDLMAANNLKSPNKIFVGQRLILPGGGASGTTADSDAIVTLLQAQLRSGFNPFSDSQLSTVFPSGAGGAGCPCVILDFALGIFFKKGDVISLSRVTGGKVSGGENGCLSASDHRDHLHPVAAIGIKIDGKGPFTDPDKFGCGYGLVKG